MSTPNAQAIEPKRQRGRDRVEAIMEAATSLFAEKRYDSVTMTEVAARSSTAIGSLYRFFPTKEILASALLQRYAERLIGALDSLLEQPDAASPAVAARGLLTIVQDLRRDRSVALSLLDADGDHNAERHTLRVAMIERLERLIPPGERRKGKATLLLHLIKMMFRLQQEGFDAVLDEEAETAVRAYLETAIAS